MTAATPIEQTAVTLATADGAMPAFLFTPSGTGPHPAVLLLMEAFGLTQHLQDVARRIAREGYVVLTPDLYYRERSPQTFGYDEVEQAMATMYRLDLQAVEPDIRAALADLKARPEVHPQRIGVTGFCLGGGLTFLTACRFSNLIACAAAFYGMVLDEWIDAAKEITVPLYLFHGGVDPFIPAERLQQIEARLQALNKDYRLKVYPEANHGFFCHERGTHHPAAAADAWQELTHFFGVHLQDKGKGASGNGCVEMEARPTRR